MKKIILSTMFLILATATFSQQTNPSPTLTKQDYLEKSKKQKTTAWVMLGGGAILILLGNLIGNGQSSSFSDAATGVVIGGVGVLSMLGSIPVFIASAKNKRRAMAATVFFKMEKAPLIQYATIVSRSYPAVSVKINMR